MLPSMRRTRSSAARRTPSSESRIVTQCSKREPERAGPDRRGNVQRTFGIAARIRARTSTFRPFAGFGAGIWSPSGRCGKGSLSFSRTSSLRRGSRDGRAAAGSRDGRAEAVASADSIRLLPIMHSRAGRGASLRIPTMVSPAARHKKPAMSHAKPRPTHRPQRAVCDPRA